MGDLATGPSGRFIVSPAGTTPAGPVSYSAGSRGTTPILATSSASPGPVAQAAMIASTNKGSWELQD